MDKSNWGDAATSEARECSNTLIKTTQSSQRNVFSIKTKVKLCQTRLQPTEQQRGTSSTCPIHSCSQAKASSRSSQALIALRLLSQSPTAQAGASPPKQD